MDTWSNEKPLPVLAGPATSRELAKHYGTLDGYRLLQGYALSNAGWSGLDCASSTVSEDVGTRTERLSGQFMMITEFDEPASNQAEFKYEVQRESDGTILSILYTPSGDGRY
jgi:hypothetical protein